MNIAKPLFAAVAVASLTLAGCATAPGEVEEQLGTAQQKALNFNALNFNALNFNALNFNALNFNALNFNALNFNALNFNALMAKDLEDPNAREVFKYIVSCALPASETLSIKVQGVTYDFPGELGLTPEWGEVGGHCDDMCQQWVSACVISRLDYTGATVEISSRGDNPGLATTPTELADYTVREATYYGNIFTSPMKIYGCLSPGQTEDTRVCGPTIQGCGVDILGSCADLCGAPRQDGSFPDCRAPDGDDGSDHKTHDWDDVYHGSITVYLEP